jgi:hypothetical protein
MSEQTRRTRRRRARYLVVILFAFGCVSSLWDAQAANADVVLPSIISVTTLDSTGVFISDEGTVPVTSLNGLTSIPGTTVLLSDSPVVVPIAPSDTPTTSIDAPASVSAVVAPGNLTFTSSHGCDPETDYASGALNTDARAYIDNLLANGWSIRISCIKEGHSADVHGTNRVSLHTSGEAFDIDQINGQTVAPSSLESNRFYRWMKAQPNTALPWEIGGPHVPSGRTKLLRNQGQTGGPFFTNSGHKGHWHFGFKANTGTFAVPAGSVEASSSPDPNKLPSPQTPVFVLPPPSVKEEKVQPTIEVAPTDQPDPNGDGTMPDPLPIDPIAPLALSPVIDAPSVAPPVMPALPDQPVAPETPTVTPAPVDPPSPIVIPSQPTSSDGSDTAKAISIDTVQLQADYDRLAADGVLPIIRQIASDNNIPFAVALGLVSRETHGRNELGDGGHGHCYLQIDDRAHGDWLSNHDWREPAQCFGFGLGILSHDYAMHDGNMFEALAAYNSGNGNVHKALHKGLSAEAYTAHANYASDVLARAGFYYTLLDNLASSSSALTPADLPQSEVAP